MFCPFCRAQLPDTALFCGSCGKRIPQNREHLHVMGEVSVGSSDTNIAEPFQRGLSDVARSTKPHASLASIALQAPIAAVGMYLLLDLSADVFGRAPQILNTLSLHSVEFAIVGSALFYVLGVLVLFALCRVVVIAARGATRNGESGLHMRYLVATLFFVLLMVLVVAFRMLAPRIPLLDTAGGGILLFPFEVFGGWIVARAPLLVLIVVLLIANLFMQRGSQARRDAASAYDSSSEVNHETS